VRITRPITSALLAVGIVACCVATANASTARAARPAASHRPVVHQSRRPKVQLGIDVDYYSNPGVNVPATDKALVSYIKSLHANSVSISFPFYVSGPRASSVSATAATPTPTALGELAGTAEHAGLYVSIRPLLDQGNLHESRLAFKPANAGAWFASYEKFLRPYAVMAQHEHVQAFIEGAELNSLGGSPYWTKLDAYLRTVYHGTLAYSNNFSPRVIKKLTDKEKVLQLLDDYHPVKAGASASVATLSKGWDSFLATEPRGVTIAEAGIAAEDNAYARPYALNGQGAFNPLIQVRWFSAACDAVTKEHLGGLYFWSVVFGAALNVPPGPSNPTAFAAGPGAREISACFKKLG
jgi:hypothetical protein